MAQKVEKKVEKPTVKAIRDKAGKIPLKGQQPQQPQMTEEQAFMQYTNQIISNVILDIEGTKTRAVDSIKQLIQQLSMYMNAVKKLEKENADLKKGKEKKK